MLPAALTESSLDKATGPRIVVVTGDPRFFVMQHFEGQALDEIGFNSFLDRLLMCSQEDATAQALFGCGSSLAWAQAEALHPEHVRLLFIEDFILQPEIAMRGLASFLGAPLLSNVTEDILQNAAKLVGAIDLSVAGFEERLASAPHESKVAWSQLVQAWLKSSSPRMTEIANCVLRHTAWEPPQWWAAHSSRACRPCLFFPRGLCKVPDEGCGFCHGPGHKKPKRLSPGKRRRRQAQDRTPSPDARFGHLGFF